MMLGLKGLRNSNSKANTSSYNGKRNLRKVKATDCTCQLPFFYTWTENMDVDPSLNFLQESRKLLVIFFPEDLIAFRVSFSLRTSFKFSEYLVCELAVVIFLQEEWRARVSFWEWGDSRA